MDVMEKDPCNELLATIRSEVRQEKLMRTIADMKEIMEANGLMTNRLRIELEEETGKDAFLYEEELMRTAEDMKEIMETKGLMTNRLRIELEEGLHEEMDEEEEME